MYFPTQEGKLPFTFYIHWQKGIPSAKLAIGFSDGVRLSTFALPNEIPSKLSSYVGLSKASTQIRGISDKVNTTRLFGKIPANGVYVKEWLSLNGVTPEGEAYIPYDKGTVEIGKQTDNYTEVFFTGSKLSGRWLLRKIPNVFDPSLLSMREIEREITVFWKPTLQASIPGVSLNQVECMCPLKALAASKNSSLGEQFTMRSKLNSSITFHDDGTFEGIATAEGTWVDMFGTKYVYTADFVRRLYSAMQARTKAGTLLVDKHHSNDDGGSIYEVSLFQDPINFVKVKGRYNGDMKDVRGLSLELRLRSSWNNEFQAWIPLEAIPDRVSLVKNPACQICWINDQVNI